MFIPTVDIAALAVFLTTWAGYAWFANRRANAPDNAQPSLMGALLVFRKLWMVEMMRRDNRIVDTSALNNLLQPCTFFASTTILILGGVLALLTAPDSITQALSALPFNPNTTNATQQARLLHEIKVFTLAGVFAYAFFKFTWAMRQYSTCTVLVVSAPPISDDPTEYDAHVSSAASIASLAGENFNLGLRGYYFGLAAVTWFLSPWVMMVITVAVVYMLYQREFHSRTLAILMQASPKANE